jgi:hypothetical protein
LVNIKSISFYLIKQKNNEKLLSRIFTVSNIGFCDIGFWFKQHIFILIVIKKINTIWMTSRHSPISNSTTIKSKIEIDDFSRNKTIEI